MKFARFARPGFSLLVALFVLPHSGEALAEEDQGSAIPVVNAVQAEQLQAGAAPLSASDLVDRVQAFYDKTRTFRAEFKQRYFVAAYRKTKDSQGTVTFQKPGKMSWRYTNNGNRVVSDGKRIQVYENDNKQMYEQSIDKSQYPAALSFLLGDAKLKTEFHLKKLDEKALGYEGGYVLLAVPKNPTPAYQQLLLYVDAGTYQVRRVLMIDAQQNRNRFDFVAPSVNQPVQPQEFEFTPPPGTRVIKP